METFCYHIHVDKIDLLIDCCFVFLGNCNGDAIECLPLRANEQCKLQQYNFSSSKYYDIISNGDGLLLYR